jgi:uncharacterized DUF497 family protein
MALFEFDPVKSEVNRRKHGIGFVARIEERRRYEENQEKEKAAHG